jgi:hypothetical protein
MRMLRHSLFSVFLLITAVSFLLGGAWLWLGFGFLVAGAVSLDVFLPDDLSSHSDSNPGLMNFFLFMTLPLLALNVLLFNWQMATGDFLRIGALFLDGFGIDLMTAKNSRTLSNGIGAYHSLSILIAAAGTVVAHELVHRVWDKKSLITGRWLLAMSCDTSFSIEHVYGHHANVATLKDPASARRGESFWMFLPRSAIGSFKGAWAIERKRIETKKLGRVWGWKNIFIRGQVMSLALMLFFVLAQGLIGIGSFLIVAASAKIFLEVINYIEHYGLSREVGEKVDARHSWNCNARFSLFWLYNLPRHPHHHAKGHLPFWKLEANPGGPTLPFGYMTMILIAIFPPLYKRVMEKRILALEALRS